MCSRGGGGMLKERMALARELWTAGVRAQFLQAASPSLTAHYEFANAHRIPWLAVIERNTFSAADTVKVPPLVLANSYLKVCKPLVSSVCPAWILH